MNKLFSVHSLDDSQRLPESDFFMSLFNFSIYRQQRLFFKRLKKFILGLLFRTFGHVLESQSTQKHVYTDILPDPVIRFSKRSCCFEIVS